MWKPQRVGVIGAGNMGLQAAMFLADHGYPVYLFDRPGVGQKNLAGAVKKGLGTLTGRQRVTVLDFVPENYDRLRECDWILEAVFEDRAAKETVNAIIAHYKKPEAIVSTNTSGIGLNELAQAAVPGFARRYCLTHFFNPINVLPLLEVCWAKGMDGDVYEAFCEFLEFGLGKKLVQVRDTPNFVGNRIGGLALFLPFRIPHEGLSIADIEAIMLALFGWQPFKTWDIVGLDLAKPVAGNVFERAPDDPLHAWWNPEVPEIQALLERGFVGRKGQSQSGFLARDGKNKLCWDVAQGKYVPAELTGYPALANAQAAKSQKDKLRLLLTPDSTNPDVCFAREAFFTLAAYSAHLVGKICREPEDIDTCLEDGFNWPAGIFRLAEMLGLRKTIVGVSALGRQGLLPDWFLELGEKDGHFYEPSPAGDRVFSVTEKEMVTAPSVEDGVYPERMALEHSRVVEITPEMIILEISDRNDYECVLLALIATKGNAIGTGVLDGLNQALDQAERRQAGLVIAGQGRMFGAGADLRSVLQYIEQGNTDAIRRLIAYGQETLNRLCFSPVPTVAAPHGITFGGSCEICLACDRRVVNANVVMGQTELRVGVTPGWGGLMRPLKRAMSGLPVSFLWGRNFRVPEALNIIDGPYRNYGWILTSRDGYHAREMGFLGPEDVIVPAQGPGQPWVLRRAKEVVQGMLMAGYEPPRPFVFNLPGEAGYAKLALAADQGLLMDAYPVPDPEHNTICAKAAARVLCGGNTSLGQEVTERQLLGLEAEAFLDVVMRPGAKAYIERLLKKS